MRSKTFPLAMPKELLAEVRRAARKTGLSMADTMRQSMKLGLDPLVRKLAPPPRITNVDPLPDDVLNRCYSRAERDEAGIDRLIKAQKNDSRPGHRRPLRPRKTRSNAPTHSRVLGRLGRSGTLVGRLQK